MTTLLTPAEVASRLRCSRKTLDAHVRAGDIRYVSIGHGKKRPRRMFTEADVAAQAIWNIERGPIDWTPMLDPETEAKAYSTPIRATAATSWCRAVQSTRFASN